MTGDCFLEDVVSDDRGLCSFRHAGQLGTRDLVLDLHAIADRIHDQIVFDQSCDERSGAVGISEIKRRAGREDRVSPDDPVPRWSLGRNAVGLLVRSGANDQVAVENDVMRGGMQRRHSLDAVRAGDSTAVDYQVAEDDIAGIDDLDGPVADLSKNDGGPVSGQSRNGDATAGRTGETRYSEARVLSRRQDQRITRNETADHPAKI